MYILGDIGNTETKIFLISVNNKIIRKLTFSTNDMNLTKLNKLFINFKIDYKNKTINFSVTCNKGTYIRSLAHDFGKALKSGAHLTGLRRTKIGSFSVENATSIEDFISTLS